jgi:hypothetical protein
MFLAQQQFIDWKGGGWGRGGGADEKSKIRILTCQSTAGITENINSEKRLPSAEFNNTN